MKLLVFKNLLYTNGVGGYIVTLEDGRCALVNAKTGYVDVDVFLDTYLKWGGFNKANKIDNIERIKEILKKPEKVYFSPLAEDYLANEEIKKEMDILKKDEGYDY